MNENEQARRWRIVYRILDQRQNKTAPGGEFGDKTPEAADLGKSRARRTKGSLPQ